MSRVFATSPTAAYAPLFALILLTHGCSENATAPEASLNCALLPCGGITETDVEGRLIGKVDPGDWKCGTDTDGPAQWCAAPATPNPAPVESSTMLRLAIPFDSNVRIDVFACLGRPVRRVRTLANREFVAGQHHLTWNLTDESGRKVAPGLYRVVIQSGNWTSCGDVTVTR